MPSSISITGSTTVTLQQEEFAKPCLLPLRKSFDSDAVTGQLKQIFMMLFNKYLRDQERDLNLHGMAHLGSFDLVSRFVERDGLALPNNGDKDAMRYLYQAWRGRNPKRGLHFLNTYLQIIFGDKAHAKQQWHLKSKTYPTGLVDTPDDGSGTKYLTSRINVALDASLLETGDINVILGRTLPAMRSAIGAKYILNTSVPDADVTMNNDVHADAFFLMIEKD